MKRKILSALDDVKKLPIYLFVIISLIIIIWQYYFISKIWVLTTVLSIVISYIYFVIVFHFIEKRNSIKFLEFVNIYKYYKTYKFNYLKKQLKHVFTEEFLLRYLPIILVGFFFESKYVSLLIIIVSMIFFTYLHRFSHVIELIEFTFFFGITYCFFALYHDFGILFLSHLTRNLLIEYQIKKTKKNG